MLFNHHLFLVIIGIHTNLIYIGSLIVSGRRLLLRHCLERESLGDLRFRSSLRREEWLGHASVELNL